MLTGEALTNALVDELNDLGLPNMAATLDARNALMIVLIPGAESIYHAELHRFCLRWHLCGMD